jgi:hypothetical protein
MIEEQIKNLIVPTSSHIPAIGSRMYVGGLPDSVTYPAVAMFSISRFDRMHDAPLNTERIQFSCYADYLSSATTIAESIISKLERYQGQESTLENYKIINAKFGNMNYLYDSGVSKYVRLLDMVVRYVKL